MARHALLLISCAVATARPVNVSSSDSTRVIMDQRVEMPTHEIFKALLNATPDAISAAECWFARDGTPPPLLPYDRPAVLDSMCPYAQFYRCECNGASSRSASGVRRHPLDAVPALV